MKKLKLSVFTITIVFWAFGASTALATDLVQAIWQEKSFIATLRGYDADALYDIRSIGGKRIGVIFLEPMGYLKQMVFDGETRKPIYEDVSIPKKEVRQRIREMSILFKDAKILIKSLDELSGQ